MSRGLLPARPVTDTREEDATQHREREKEGSMPFGVFLSKITELLLKSNRMLNHGNI
jgi:hypothetical protein